ncbi:MAG: hypothetical protein SO063_06885 [Eubacteriales bacterium]|nr:hypothetical protein [Eubacteriales bacterium]MDY5015777.1 hypothetical protein [Eubacteriales bacterium]
MNPSEIETRPADAAPSEPENAVPETPSAPETPSPAEALPVPDDETLLSLLEPLRARYPRLDGEALIASDAFRAYGERVGWDSRELSAGLGGLLDGARALADAAEPPVPRSTGASAVRRRPLLSPSQQRDLADWNRSYPQYKMTELEYFSALKNN